MWRLVGWIPYIGIFGGKEVTIEKVARSIYFIGLLIISPSARRTSRLFEPDVKWLSEARLLDFQLASRPREPGLMSVLDYFDAHSPLPV